MKRMSILALVFLSGWLSAGGQSAQERYETILEEDVSVKMRDGVVLKADIYRPQAKGKFPVLLCRTPYDKQGEKETAIKGAERGYVVIVQDVRGRYESEGEWYPFKYESADGYDTVEWAAALPYSNGKVGMFGGSYVGATQFLSAIAHPPHLAGLFPVDTASNYHDGWTYQSGAFEQWFSESWTSNLSRNTLNRRSSRVASALPWFEKLPLSAYPVQDVISQKDLAPYFFDWLAHPAYDNFWQQWSIEDHHSQITVPVFHVGAWYDIFLGGTLRNYVGLTAGAGSEEARRNQRLHINVGGHAGGGPKVGEVEFGKQSAFNEDEALFRWYDYILKGVANGLDREPPVRIFVMGKNVWRDENEWPLAKAKTTRFYLQSTTGANSLLGNGSLARQQSASKTAAASDKISYDPTNPAPTKGGPLCCDSAHRPGGPWGPRPVEARPDVLVYTTSAFQEEFETTGPVSLELYVSSSAVDTDFTAKLVDVWPNGFAQNLAEGILRMRYRDSQEKMELMNPGEIYKITIDMTGTSNVFLPGHRLRLEVSSSNFPRFDRNLNTRENAAGATRSVTATNTVWHDREHPSALILPAVPR